MTMPSIFARRFNDLCAEADALEASKHHERSVMMEGIYIDNDTFLTWKVKVNHLLAIVCGENSQHFRLLKDSQHPFAGDTNYGIFRRMRAVLLAAKSDYEGGLLTRVRNLVQAEVFVDELDQAQELLDAGYITASAVIAGVVLETTLRQSCNDLSIPIGKLDKMNADLAKAGVYNLLVQKQITALADIRNNAAHGHIAAFSAPQVERMIQDVRKITADLLTS
jgi:hypothetical protein